MSSPAIIAVMGATGTGKSTFINTASNGRLQVSHKLQSCTSEVVPSPEFEINGTKVVLVDTPGFDDTTLSDTEILRRIASHLELSYRKGFTLCGLLYLHKISDTRMGGISRRNFGMFRKLCGDETLKNVIIVTTMWDGVDQELKEAREWELANDERYFKPAIDKGATMLRHDNTTQTAHAILSLLLPKEPLALQIQRELVDENVAFQDTAASGELNRELQALEEKHTRELAELRKELLDAITAMTRRELEQVKRELQEEMKQLRLERERMQEMYEAEKKKTEQAQKNYEIEKKKAEKAQRNYEAEKRKAEKARANSETQTVRQVPASPTTSRNIGGSPTTDIREEGQRGGFCVLQ